MVPLRRLSHGMIIPQEIDPVARTTVSVGRSPGEKDGMMWEQKLHLLLPVGSSTEWAFPLICK